LLILTIGLLLAAAATLVVGFVERSLALDYVSIGASAICVVLLVVFTALNRVRDRGATAPSVGRRRRETAGSETDTVAEADMVEDNRPTQLVEAVRPPAGRRTPRVLRGAGRKARPGAGAEIDEPDVPEAAPQSELEPLPAVVPVRRSYLASGRRGAPDQGGPESGPAAAELEPLPEPVPERRSRLGSRRRAAAEEMPPEPAQAGAESEPLPEPVPARRSLLGSRRRTVAEEISAEADQADAESEPLPEPVTVPVRRSLLGSRRGAVAEETSARPSISGPESEPVLEAELAVEAESVVETGPGQESMREPVRRSLLGSRRRTAVPSRADMADQRDSTDQAKAADEAGGGNEVDQVETADQEGVVPAVGSRRGRIFIPPAISQPMEPAWEDSDVAEQELESEPQPQPAAQAEPVPVRRSFFGSRRRSAEEEAPWPAEEEAWSQGASTPYANADPDAVFPIADYDELMVSEIMPLLEELVPDEYDVVRQRELATRGRSTILRRLDELRATEPMLSGMSTPEFDASPEAYADDDMFPIADYDDLRVAEILPLLRQLDPEELEVVRSREQAGAARTTVLKRINTIVGSANGASAGPVRAQEEARAKPAKARAPRATKPSGSRTTASVKSRATKASAAGTSKATGARPRKAPGTATRQAAGAGSAGAGSAGAGSAGAGSSRTPAGRGTAIPPTKRPPVGTGPRLVSRRPSGRSGRGT